MNIKKIIFQGMLNIVFIITIITGRGYADPPPPVLLFSDIISGPRDGLNDGVGQGAIVTIWGKRLGSSQGTSRVLCNGIDAAHVYYWENADPETGDSGPADLYSYQKMQEIAFSIPSNVPLGPIKIKVVVNDVSSNELNFTIRSGNIYYVKSNGNNSLAGTWGNPWANVDYFSGGAASKSIVKEGDIIYVCDGVAESRVVMKDKVGTAEKPISLIAYPGASYVSNGSISHHSNSCAYWNFSKIIIRSDNTGISAFRGMRVVGCEITDIVCADGQSGAISANANNMYKAAGGYIKCFGNYIHDFGGSCTTNLHHVFYISNRSGTAIEPFELGWNYLKDNEANGGLHLYDEGICGDFTGTIKIHDNVVVNQVGPGIGLSAYGDNCITCDVLVYNNILVGCGKSPRSNLAIAVNKSGFKSHIKFYNNVIYGYGEPGAGEAIWVQGSGSSMWVFGGTWDWFNNIVVDTNNLPYEKPNYSSVPMKKGNNIWYSGGDGNPSALPAWDINPISKNPEFVNPENGDFRLTKDSPARDAGTTP